MTRRKFLPILGTLAGCFFTLSLGQCHEETGGESIQKLRTILNQVEASLKILIAFGLANEVIQQAAKYLESVTAFVNGAAEVLENTVLSVAEKAAKIVAISATVALPHFNDSRVQDVLLKVQTAVDAFVAIWRAVNPPEVKLTATTRKLLDQIEHDAQHDSTVVEQWAEKAGGH